MMSKTAAKNTNLSFQGTASSCGAYSKIEVPEIYHGVVEIRSIAREPGQRAKVAFRTNKALTVVADGVRGGDRRLCVN